MWNALQIVLLIALLIGVALLILSLGTFLIFALPARHSRQARTEGVLRELLEENHIKTSTPSGVNQIRFLRETLTANDVDSSDSIVDSRRPPPRYERLYRHAAELLKETLSSEAGELLWTRSGYLLCMESATFQPVDFAGRDSSENVWLRIR